MLINLLPSVRLLISQCLSPHNYLFSAYIAWIALWLSIKLTASPSSAYSKWFSVCFSWSQYLRGQQWFTIHKTHRHVQTKGWNEHLISLIPRSSSNLDHSQTKMKKKGLSCEWHQAKQRRFQTSLRSVSRSVYPSTERPRHVQNTFFWLVTLPPLPLLLS